MKTILFTFESPIMANPISSGSGEATMSAPTRGTSQRNGFRRISSARRLAFFFFHQPADVVGKIVSDKAEHDPVASERAEPAEQGDFPGGGGEGNFEEHDAGGRGGE